MQINAQNDVTSTLGIRRHPNLRHLWIAAASKTADSVAPLVVVHIHVVGLCSMPLVLVGTRSEGIHGLFLRTSMVFLPRMLVGMVYTYSYTYSFRPIFICTHAVSHCLNGLHWTFLALRRADQIPCDTMDG